MSKKAVLEIISKIFGLYCIVQFIKSTPGVIVSILIERPDFIQNKVLHVVLMSLYPLAFMFLSYIFLSKSELITKLFKFTEDDRISTETTLSPKDKIYGKLHFLIIILGIFYFISAISTVLIGIGTLAIKLKEGMYIIHDPLLPQAIILILSLICIFRSEQVAKFIETNRRKLNKRLQSDAQ